MLPTTAKPTTDKPTTTKPTTAKPTTTKPTTAKPKLQSLQAFGKLKHNGKVTNSLDSIDIQIDYSLFFSIFYYRISTFAGI
jgi:hypothetical protein